MQILPALFVAAVATASPSSDLTRSDPVLVRAVIDGDTIDVATYGRVRLLGIDAPELGRGFDTAAPFAAEARARLASLVLHRWVRLERDAVTRDAYDRHLAYVIREDGVFVNAALVRLGELQRAEAEAQAFRRGMWGAAPQIPAASYTRRSGTRKTPGAAPGKRRANAPKPKAKPKHPRGSDSC